MKERFETPHNITPESEEESKLKAEISKNEAEIVISRSERKQEIQARKQEIEPSKEIQKLELKENKEEERDLVDILRLPQRYESEPVSLPIEAKKTISEIATVTKERIRYNYLPGFGVIPSAKPMDNFYNQLFARDFAHASGNYFAVTNAQALIDSMETILKHQRASGELPYKVERQYTLLKQVPILGKFDQAIFNFIEGKLRRRKERPTYEGQDLSGNEDTVPATIIALGEFFIASKEGRQFVREHYDQLKKAVDFFRAKTDPTDGLFVAVEKRPADWADSINRKGKLGGINVWWARSLRLMEYMSRELGYEDDAEAYRKEFRLVKQNVLEKLYDHAGGYFRTKEGEDRIDTPASVFGALYLLPPSEAVRVEETLGRRVKSPIGLKNFDPPYPQKDIFLSHRLFGHSRYHNHFVWPWVTCENIQVKIRIALEHESKTVRDQYKKEAVGDFLTMSKIFKAVGGAPEIIDPEKVSLTGSGAYNLYRAPKDLLGSLAAYQGARLQLEKLGWIE